MTIAMRFHTYHGDNIQLLREGTVAHRRSSFANSIAFGEKPLRPYELFLLEINNNENGWSGHLRIGLTLLNPDHRPPLPLYALPELNASGLAWIFAITRNRHRFNAEHDFPRVGRTFLELIESHDENEIDQVSRRLDLLNANYNSGPNNNIDGVKLPTDVGSRIGVYYRIGNDNRTAEMHFVINGIDQGPSAVGIPFNGQPIYAIVDVYGTTKQVQIVQPVQAGKS